MKLAEIISMVFYFFFLKRRRRNPKLELSSLSSSSSSLTLFFVVNKTRYCDTWQIQCKHTYQRAAPKGITSLPVQVIENLKLPTTTRPNEINYQIDFHSFYFIHWFQCIGSQNDVQILVSIINFIYYIRCFSICLLWRVNSPSLPSREGLNTYQSNAYNMSSLSTSFKSLLTSQSSPMN